MATLPNDTVLGGPPDFASRRQVATYDDSAIAKAGEVVGEAIAKGGRAIGQGVEALGQGVQHAAEGIRTYIKHADALDLAKMKSDRLVQQAQADEEFKQDRNFQDLPERYGKRLQEINANVEQAGGNSRVLEQYRLWAAPRNEYALANVRSHARVVEGDVRTADAIDKLDILRQTSLTSPDPTSRIDAIQTAHGYIRGLEDAGYINATKAQAWRQKWTQDYVGASIGMLPDDEQVKQLENPPEGSMASLLPADARAALLQQAIHRQELKQIKDSAVASAELERNMIDAQRGINPLPGRKVIEDDQRLMPERRNVLLRHHDSAEAEIIEQQRRDARFNNPAGGTYNPYEADDQKAVDDIFVRRGGDLAALQAVVDRTGMVPKSVITSLRGDLSSNDPKRVASALQLASNLTNRSPTIFANAQGSKEIEDAVTTFRHDVVDLGRTAEEAATRFVESNSPEYKAKVKARIKTEDVNEIVKKKLSVDDLRGTFDSLPWIPFTGKPTVGFTADDRRAMYADYVEQFHEKYGETGDVDKAKKLAQETLKKTWGVTKISGSETVMRFPPETAPAYRGIEGAADKIAEQAIGAIKEQTGQAVERKFLAFTPLGERTSMAYWRGEPPPYLVYWFNKKGEIEMLAPGKGFVADPKTMRATQTAEREKAFGDERKIKDLTSPSADTSSGRFGNPSAP